MVLEEFDEDLEEPRNEKNIFLRGSGSEKRSRGTRNGEILVPSLFKTGLN